jgi:arsenate reductase (glutaredoxin)
MTITLYGIPNCDTVKRARAWLAQQGHAHHFHDFKKAGVPSPELEQWLRILGRESLVNRQGLTWKKLADAERAQASTDAGARALLLAQPSLIKRPVVQWPDGAWTLGFDAALWAARLPGAV